MAATALLASVLLAIEPAPLPVERQARQPQVAVGSDGRVLIAYGVGNAVRCVSSPDGGATFGEPATVGEAGVLALGRRRGPRAAIVGDAAIVSAVAGPQGKGKDGDILAWRSPDGGKTWGKPARLNRVAGSGREGLHALASGPDGRAFCAWLDLRDGRTELYGASTADGGETWSPDTPIYRSPSGSICECCHPSVAFAPNGTLWVMFRNQVEGARDIYLARSRDGGKSFDPARKLGAGTWELDACPMDGGALAAPRDGSVATIWRRDRDVFLAAPGRPEKLLGPGRQPWIAAGPSGTYAAWLDGRALVAIAPGSEAPIRLAPDASDPVVASGPGGSAPVIAAWEGPDGLAFARLDRQQAEPTPP